MERRPLKASPASSAAGPEDERSSLEASAQQHEQQARREMAFTACFRCFSSGSKDRSFEGFSGVGALTEAPQGFIFYFMAEARAALLAPSTKTLRPGAGLEGQGFGGFWGVFGGFRGVSAHALFLALCSVM